MLHTGTALLTGPASLGASIYAFDQVQQHLGGCRIIQHPPLKNHSLPQTLYGDLNTQAERNSTLAQGYINKWNKIQTSLSNGGSVSRSSW